MGDAPIPKEAKIVSLILKSVGVDECEPKVIQQLIELMYSMKRRHTTEVLQDSLLYCEHAGRTEINAQDVRLALQSRVNHSFVPPPPREFLVDIAAKKNSIPLPLIPEEEGVLRLPPEKYCLVSANYRLTSQALLKAGSRPLRHFPSEESLKDDSLATMKRKREE